MYIRIIAGMLGLVSLLTVGLANAAPKVMVVELAPANSVSVGDTIALTVQGLEFENNAKAGNVSLTWDTDSLELQSTNAEINYSLFSNGWGRFENPAVAFDPTSGQLDIAAFKFTAVGPDFNLASLTFKVLKNRRVHVNIDLGPDNIGDWQNGSGESITDIDYKKYRLKKVRR